MELACTISTAKTTFKTFVETVNSAMQSNSLSINELKDGFFSLKRSKSLDYDEIRFNVVKKCFDELHDSFKFIFDLSLEKRIFPHYLEIARVTPIFKGGYGSKFGNYRPINAPKLFQNT